MANLDTSTLKTFNRLYPQFIKKYETLVSGADDTISDKINSIIESLNDVGQLTNDVVKNWNTVMQWVLNDGLTDKVTTKIDDMYANGDFTTLIEGSVFTDFSTRLTANETSLNQKPNLDDDSTSMDKVWSSQKTLTQIQLIPKGDKGDKGDAGNASLSIVDNSISTASALSSKAATDIIYGNLIKTYGNTGQDATYTKGQTRINGTQIIENLRLNKISVYGQIGNFKILELTKNNDGTFNLKNSIYIGHMSNGYNEFYLDYTVTKGSYIGFYSASGAGDAQISYAGTGGVNYSYAGEITGNNFTVSQGTLSLNFALYGTTVGVSSLGDDVNAIYDNKTVTYGNQLVGTNATPVNRINLLGTPTPKRGKVTAINILTQGAGEASILLFQKLSNGNFKFIKVLAEVTLVSGVNNIPLTDFIEAGMYLGFYNPSGSSAVLAYANDGSGYYYSGYTIDENVVFTTTSANFAMNLTIQYEGLRDIALDLYNLQNDTLEGKVFELKKTIGSDFYNDGNWVDNNAPTVANSILYYNTPFGLDKWISRLEVTPTDSLSMPVIVMCQPVEGGIYVKFDLANNKIQIMSNWDGNVANEQSVLAEGTITIPIVINRKYIMSIEKDTVKTLTATIQDDFTTASFSVQDITTGDAHLHGDGRHIGLIHKSGKYTRGKFILRTKQKTKPRLMIYGDSYVVGYNLIRAGLDINYRYAKLVSDALNGNVSISAKGGEDTNGLIQKITSDFQLFHPKYTLLAIGLNDDILGTTTFDQYKANMGKLINAVRNTGSIPILTTYPRLNGAGIASSFNSWVRNYSGCKYVDIHRATSIDGTDSGSPDNTQFFLADGHPNIAGNQRIFDKFKMDCPYVFYEQ